MDVQSPESPRRISLRLDVYPLPQVLQICGRLCHLVLAFLVVRGVTNSRVPWLHGSYSASSLLRTQPPPSRLRPLSRRDRLYDLPCSADFSMGRGGFLQLLSMSLSPCCRIPPRRGEVTVSFRFRLPMLPSPLGCGLGPRFKPFFRGHIRVHCRYGPVTRRLPWGDVVDRLQSFGHPPPCYPSYGFLTISPIGLPPIEHASLDWTHSQSNATNPAVADATPRAVTKIPVCLATLSRSQTHSSGTRVRSMLAISRPASSTAPAAFAESGR